VHTIFHLEKTMSIRFTFSLTRPKVLVAVMALVLSACGGSDRPQAVPGAPIAAMAFSTKSADLFWPSVPGATHYEVYETPDVGQDPVLLGTTTQANFSQPIALYKKFNASYSIKACSAGGCSAPSDNVAVGGDLGELSKAIGYIKASNPGGEDRFGSAVALSADGNTLAVGAYTEDSATTINGDQTNNDARGSGAVYVFSRTVNPVTNTGTWVQQAFIKASNAGVGDSFGFTVALSGDGNTLAVGAHEEDSSATQVNGDQTNNDATNSGAVYVFSRTVNPTTNTSTWAQQAYIKASNALAGDRFGWSVAISADGTTLAVGAPVEDSAATGINGGQNNNSTENSGAVYVFTRTASVGNNTSTWTQQAYIKAFNREANDFFGFSVALSADGNTLAVAANQEDSATGIDSDGTDNSAVESGAVYIFNRTASSGTWSHQAYLKASTREERDFFGTSVALSADGNTLAVGAVSEGSAATGINGDELDNSAPSSGAVYVFHRTIDSVADAATWEQQAYVKASNPGAGDEFGVSVTLSADGNTLAVGAQYESGAATGMNGDQTDKSTTKSGAAYVFFRTVSSSTNTSTWSQQAFLKAPNTQADDYFGTSVALSADGNALAVGARKEDSAATGINGDQTNNAAQDSGAVYLY
jgi:hypothetical protein